MKLVFALVMLLIALAFIYLLLLLLAMLYRSVTKPSGTNRWRLLISSETIAKCRTRKQQVVWVTEGRRP
jgi:hypothetical protein